jgi:membrane-bound lytic murein transglycosylase B
LDRARQALQDAGVASRAAHQAAAAAAQRQQSQQATLDTLSTRIAALEPVAAAEVARFADTSSQLRTAAVDAYVSGGYSTDVTLTALVSSTTANDFSLRRSMATFPADHFAQLATRHRDEAARLDQQMAALSTERAAHQTARDAAARDVITANAAVTVADDNLDAAEASLRAAVANGSRVGMVAGLGAVDDINAVAMSAYVRAAERLQREQPDCRISWWVLAGIGRIESGHGNGYGGALGPDGRINPPILGPVLDGTTFKAVPDTDGGLYDGDTTWDRAVGPMQFLPSTWRGYIGDGVSDPNNYFDATLAAGRYLCRNSGGAGLDNVAGFRLAAFAYNHSARYVDQVLEGARRYGSLNVGTPGPRFIFAGGDPAAWARIPAVVSDVAPARSFTGTALAALVAAPRIPQRSTVVVVAGPSDPVADTIGAAQKLADALLGRRVFVVVSGPDPAAADQVRAAVNGVPGVGVLAVPGVDLPGEVGTVVGTV